jgi:glucokinase
MKHYIAIDIGGTQMRAALFQKSNLTKLDTKRIATQSANATPLERLYELITSIWPGKGRVAGIGVAAPGPVNPYTGTVIEAPNIPGWSNIALREKLEKRFEVPVALGNDANLAALGEWRFGAGQGYHHLIYVTVSTGIGGGVINDDKLLLGAQGLAAELGHLTVMIDGPLCGCGQRGHLEAVASGPAITRWVEQELSQGIPSSLPTDKPLSAKDIAAAARKGDRLATAALQRSGTFLGQALADYLHIFNPSALIIGGGVSQSGPLLLEPLWNALREHVFTDKYLEDLTLTTAALGDDAGLMGSLALASQLEA